MARSGEILEDVPNVAVLLVSGDGGGVAVSAAALAARQQAPSGNGPIYRCHGLYELPCCLVTVARRNSDGAAATPTAWLLKRHDAATAATGSTGPSPGVGTARKFLAGNLRRLRELCQSTRGGGVLGARPVNYTRAVGPMV